MIHCPTHTNMSKKEIPDQNLSTTNIPFFPPFDLVCGLELVIFPHTHCLFCFHTLQSDLVALPQALLLSDTEAAHLLPSLWVKLSPATEELCSEGQPPCYLHCRNKENSHEINFPIGVLKAVLWDSMPTQPHHPAWHTQPRLLLADPESMWLFLCHNFLFAWCPRWSWHILLHIYK